MTCPRCKGEKRGHGFVMRESGCGFEPIDCSLCDGKGEVTSRLVEAWEYGQRMRRERIARDESLREAAKRLGISPVELSALERGRPAEEEGAKP